MRIEKIDGTANRLYRLVASLVMNPEVLRQNNNYPFKTSVDHIWYIAFKGKKVMGFIPLETRNGLGIINNYYVAGDDSAVLSSMLQEVIRETGERSGLQSVTHIRHLSVFEENGFATVRTWKLYVKMEYRKTGRAY